MFTCVRYRNRLGAYLDGELNLKEREAIEAHLAKCAVCLRRLEDIRSLDGPLKDTLHVPPVPKRFAVRVMMEARRIERPEAAPARPFPPIGWTPLRWIAGLSAPMRVAACLTVLLAIMVGWYLDGGWLTRGGVSSESKVNLYGLEWFNPAPTGSIGSVYLAMVDEDYGKGRR